MRTSDQGQSEPPRIAKNSSEARVHSHIQLIQKFGPLLTEVQGKHSSQYVAKPSQFHFISCFANFANI